MTEVNIAWAAGLFEGEGCCFVGAGKRQTQPAVSVVMTDEDVVRRFAEIMGVGHVNSYHRLGQKRYWRWSAQSRNDVLEVLGLLWPYLGERRKQKATEVIERAAQLRPSGERATHCKHGHPFDEENTYYYGKKRQCRECRACRRAQGRPIRAS